MGKYRKHIRYTTKSKKTTTNFLAQIFKIIKTIPLYWQEQKYIPRN